MLRVAQKLPKVLGVRWNSAMHLGRVFLFAFDLAGYVFL